jgi:replicative DNA helicase
MLEKDAYTAVCDILKPESFYDPSNQRIYEAIQTLAAGQRPIDLLTVIDQLRLNNTLDEVGGASYIAQLTSNVTSAAHVEFHARIVAQKYLARELISFASQIENKAFDESNDVDDLLQEAEGKLFEISQRNVKKDVTQIDPVISQAIEQMQFAANRTSGLSGLETGFHNLDKLTSGWQNSDLVIIAARPAMGKTAFVLSMAKNMAVNYNTPVAIFSLEMSNLQLVNRLISNVCELEGSKIKSGQLTDVEWSQTMARLKHLNGAPLYIDDSPSLSIFELRTKARRLVREHNVKIIIIDYLQLMNASGMKYGSREQEVSMISRSLKQLAKELNIPIIALSQLNRSVESRTENKRPQLSDLRESGAIEQDADMVCFIHRPEYYLHSGQDAEGNDIRGLAQFIVAKHRSGAVDDVKMRFRAAFARFENWEEDASDNNTNSDGTNAYTQRSSRLNGGEDTTQAAFSGGSADIIGTTNEEPPF